MVTLAINGGLPMLPHFLFFTMLALLFTHELDAVKRHEWRVLPLTSFLPERIEEQVFVWMHVPLFLAIFWFVGNDPNSGFGLFLSGFSVLHVALHWLLRRHRACEFNNPSSWALIISAGAFGALHILSVNS
jgi:hypothetical protein